MLKLWRRPDAVKGTWRIRGTLGGRRYDESTGTDSRPHAEAILAKRQKEILDAITFGPERTTTFAEAAELYVTAGGEVRFLEPLVLAFGPRRLADVGQADVLEFIRQRYPDTGPQGINRQVFTPLVAIYRMAHKAGMGPAPAFVRPKLATRPPVRFATDDDLNRLLPVCSDRLAGSIMLMTLGGARASEACRLVDQDVDWIRADITLRETKNGSPRVIRAGATLMAALMPLRGATGPLFGFASRYTLNQALGRACASAGLLPVFSTHEVGRHAFAARHLREGRTLLEVQKLGGWKSYRMVAEVYGHLERSSLDDAMRASGDAFRPVIEAAQQARKDPPADNVVPLPIRPKPVGQPIIHKIPEGMMALYVISAGSYVKIGITNDLDTRLRQLQHANPVRLAIAHYEFSSTRAAPIAEQHAHFLLRMRRTHERGEWFSCTIAQAKDALVQAIEHAAGAISVRDGGE